MRLLLFFVSSLFSFIFYSFYNLTNGKTITGDDKYPIELDSIFNYLGFSSSSGLIFLSVLFIAISITFLIYFSPLKISENESKNKIDKQKLYYSLFYISIIIPLYLGFFNYDLLIIFFILLFIIGDFSFNHFYKIPFLKKYEVNFKYFGLILNYIVGFVSIFYIFIIDFSYYLFLLTIFLIIFNYYVHKKYINYISLFFAIFSAFLIFLYFILKINDLYILLF